jgi:hypothetical protein
MLLAGEINERSALPGSRPRLDLERVHIRDVRSLVDRDTLISLPSIVGCLAGRRATPTRLVFHAYAPLTKIPSSARAGA